jgi:hypothetical protein
MVMARKALEPEGKWEAAQADVHAIYKRANEVQLPAMRTSSEYLLTTVRPRA